MPHYVSPDLYNRHKAAILALTNARQRFEHGRVVRGLSDVEIADRLGISPAEATEIRCIAELDLPDAASWFGADEWKEDRRESGPRPRTG